MAELVGINLKHYRLLVAIRYLNASEAIYKGLETQCEANSFHFLISMRSFIEYTRRGIWFLVWASDEKLKRAEKLTFKDPGSPGLAAMDEMISEALGDGKISHLMEIVPGINEPFLNLLHALTHGNPISVRLRGYELDKIFNLKMLLLRAQTDLGIFRILVYRHTLGDNVTDVWKMLKTIHNKPDQIQTNVLIAAHQVKNSGSIDTALGIDLT